MSAYTAPLQDMHFVLNELAGLEQIQVHRQAILARRAEMPNLPDPADLIEQLRDERDADLAATPSRD